MLYVRTGFVMEAITATIVTLNEERNIARAIESVRCCDRILVMDSGSTDRTCQVAERLGAKVVRQPWLGYAAQKNAAAEAAATEWILSLDADEALSESLDGEIWGLRTDGLTRDAYSMPRMAQYGGRWIRHSGWYPDRKTRLYHRGRARWQGEYVHEAVKVAGTVGELESNLFHFTCDSLSDHLRTMDRYTTLAAQELMARGGGKPGIHIAVGSAWTFLRTFVLQRGFLDGFEGFTIAKMAALYTFLKYAKAREMGEKKPG